MLSILLKQFQQHDVDKVALFGAHADKNLRFVLYDNENEIETPVPPCTTQTSCSRWTIITHRCIVASASTSAAAAAIGLCLSVVLSIISMVASRGLRLACWFMQPRSGTVMPSNSGIWSDRRLEQHLQQRY